MAVGVVVVVLVNDMVVVEVVVVVDMQMDMVVANCNLCCYQPSQVLISQEVPITCCDYRRNNNITVNNIGKLYMRITMRLISTSLNCTRSKQTPPYQSGYSIHRGYIVHCIVYNVHYTVCIVYLDTMYSWLGSSQL